SVDDVHDVDAGDRRRPGLWREPHDAETRCGGDETGGGRTRGHATPDGLLSERVDEERAARGNRDVLPAADRKRHRAGRHLTADAALPQLPTGTRVDR